MEKFNYNGQVYVVPADYDGNREELIKDKSHDIHKKMDLVCEDSICGYQLCCNDCLFDSDNSVQAFEAWNKATSG